MLETICDAGPSSGLENFWLILPRIPYSWPRTPPTPPPLRIGTSHGGLRRFGSEVGQEHPILGQEPPPPLSGLELLMDDLEGSGLRLAKNAHYPGNGNLVRTWDFEFWVAKNTPCPPEKWKFDQDLGIWVLVAKNTPLPFPIILVRNMVGTGVWRRTAVSPTDTVLVTDVYSSGKLSQCMTS